MKQNLIKTTVTTFYWWLVTDHLYSVEQNNLMKDEKEVAHTWWNKIECVPLLGGIKPSIYTLTR